MKKRIVIVFLSLTLLISLVGCGSGKTKLSVGDMIDNDTGEVYSLETSRNQFDDAFAYMGIEEDDNKVEYLGGILEVVFENDVAVEIECDGTTDRFAFYNFDFNTEIQQIEGRYEKFDEAAGYIFYSRFYDEYGNDTEIYNSYIEHTLMVRDGDLLNMKNGDYLHYTIAFS